jgi:tetratricopeptide (TPR) repeat protein
LISAYREIAAILVEQGKLNDAATALHRAIEHSEQVQTRLNVASIHFELALLLKTLGDFEQSKRNFLTAIDGFEKRLSENPKSLVTTVELGTALIQVDRVNEGLNYLRHAIDINPYDTEVYLTFAEALVLQKNYDEAVKQLRSGINFMLDHGKRDNAEKLRNFLESIISKNQIKQ